jgi:hypothetical protein
MTSPEAPGNAADAAGAALTWARFTRQTAVGSINGWALAFLQQRPGAPNVKAIYWAAARTLLAARRADAPFAHDGCQRRS